MKKNKRVWLLAAIFAGVYFLFYPPIYAFRDEAIYVTLSYLLKQGALFAGKPDFPLSMLIELAGKWVPVYPIGHSLVLLPFLCVGWKSLFLVGLLAHLAGWLVFKKLGKSFGVESCIASILYLFFPPFIFYSRTLMSDMPSLLIFLGAFLFYFREKPVYWLSGILFGLNLFYRVSNVVFVLPFVLALLWHAVRQRQWQPLFSFALGLLPLVLAVGGYNYWLYGSPLLTGYSPVFTGMRYFGWDYFRSNFPHYLMSLNLVYPLMLAGILLNRKFWRIEVLLSLAVSLIFFSFYYFHDYFPGSKIIELGFGTRFLFPIFPFLILSYGDWLDKIATAFPEPVKKNLIKVMTLGFIVCAVIIHNQHNQVLQKQVRLKDLIYASTEKGDAVFVDANAQELIQPVWGDRKYFIFEGVNEFIGNMKNFTPGQKVFIVERVVPYQESTIGSQVQDELQDLRNAYQVNALVSESGLVIYQVIRPQGA